jgi:hypothetical protein
MTIFISVIMGLLMIGYYCTLKKSGIISFFDYEFFACWIFGGAYFFYISSLLGSQIDKTSTLYHDFFHDHKPYLDESHLQETEISALVQEKLWEQQEKANDPHPIHTNAERMGLVAQIEDPYEKMRDEQIEVERERKMRKKVPNYKD